MLLRTFSTVEGLPVIVRSSGREIGEVLDLIFENGCVIGFLVDQTGWLNKHLFLPISDVLSFGEDGVMIEESRSLNPFSNKEKDMYSLKNGKGRLHGTPLLTKEGVKLGLVEDVYFLEEVGTIIGYEVTDGLIADLLEGRKVVTSKARLAIGGGRAILTD